jgi:hypothetical protein
MEHVVHEIYLIFNIKKHIRLAKKDPFLVILLALPNNQLSSS